MAEPTSEDKLTAVIGGPWQGDPSTYTWQVNGPAGPVTMSFQWREHGGKLSLPSGDMAIKEARDF